MFTHRLCSFYAERVADPVSDRLRKRSADSISDRVSIFPADLIWLAHALAHAQCDADVDR